MTQKKTIKQILLTALMVVMATFMGLCTVACQCVPSTTDEPPTTSPTDDPPKFPPAGYEIGKSYLVPAAAWHESDDKASMMASLLYESVYICVMDDHIDITIYLIPGTIFGIPVSPNEVENIRYLDGDVLTPVETSYDFPTDVLSIKFSLDDLNEYTTLKMDFDGLKTLRLKLKISDNVEATAEPVFDAVKRDYLVPVAAWHATNDVASMMAPLVYEYAYVTIGETSITVDIYFIKAQIQPPMGGPVTIDATAVTAFKYKDIGKEDYTDAVLTYDASTNVNRARLILSTSDIASIDVIASQVSYKMSETAQPNTASLRLMLDVDKAEITASGLQFDRV